MAVFSFVMLRPGGHGLGNGVSIAATADVAEIPNRFRIDARPLWRLRLHRRRLSQPLPSGISQQGFSSGSMRSTLAGRAANSELKEISAMTTTKLTVTSLALAGAFAAVIGNMPTPVSAEGLLEGEMLRRRAQGHERLRRGSGHDLRRHVQGGLSRQCLAAGAERLLHGHDHSAWAGLARPDQARDLTLNCSVSRRGRLTSKVDPGAPIAKSPQEERTSGVRCFVQTIVADDCASSLSARAGVGLKLEHAADVLNGGHGVGFFEIHAENYMGAGGEPHRVLSRVREIFRPVAARCRVIDWRRGPDLRNSS